MNYLKRIMLLSVTCFLVSCSSTKIEKIEKFKVLPGVSTGNTYFTFKVSITTTEETSFNNITVNGDKIVNKFSVINLDSKMQGDNSVVYSKGKYSLEFNLLFKDTDKDTKDVIKIEYRQNGKSISETAKVSETKILKLK